MSQEYIFTYYDGRGMGEPARFILSYSKADWKDNRISAQSSLPAEVKARLRFGQVPLLEFDGKR
ncbi:unnamed protein product, partial [Allacma fusca]